MIHLRDLRHNNWVLFEGIPKQVDNHTIAFHSQDFEGIPITPEILLKNGFYHRGDTKLFSQYDHHKLEFEVEFNYRDSCIYFYFLGNWLGDRVEYLYVHQLQNVILDLTGKEWEVVL